MSDQMIYLPLDLRTLIPAVLFVLGGIGALLRLMLHLFQKGLDERAAAAKELNDSMEQRIEAKLDGHFKVVQERMSALERSQQEDIRRLASLEAKHQAMQDGLVMRFVQRDDYIRGLHSIDTQIGRMYEMLKDFIRSKSDA